MLRNVLAFGVAALLAGSATAATFTVVTTLDLAQASFTTSGFNYVQGAPAFTPAAVSGTLAVGDTLDYTINFDPGQTLTLTNPTLLWAYIYAHGASEVTGTGSLSLLGPTGVPVLTSNTKTDTEGSVHFGQQFGPSDFTLLPAVVTFSGLHYVGTVDAYGAAGVTSRDYYEPAFAFSADSNVVAGIGAIPEPASWALLVAGFGLVGTAARARRTTVAA